MTFAALFASLVLGFSLMGLLHRVLADVGIHWLFVLLVPFFLVRWLSKKEPEWIPDANLRRKIALWTLFGSLVVAGLSAWLLR